MLSSKELRAKARASLGGAIYKDTWISVIAMSFLLSAVLIGLGTFTLGVGYFLFLGCCVYSLNRMGDKIAHGKKLKLGDIFCGFKEAFGESFSLMIFQSLFTSLWLIVPIYGIMKMYEYQMAFFIQQRSKDKSWQYCLNESKRLMPGFRFALFKLKVSFIGWNMLCTLCPLGWVFLLPYAQQATYEFFNERLKMDKKVDDYVDVESDDTILGVNRTSGNGNSASVQEEMQAGSQDACDGRQTVETSFEESFENKPLQIATEENNNAPAVSVAPTKEKKKINKKILLGTMIPGICVVLVGVSVLSVYLAEKNIFNYSMQKNDDDDLVIESYIGSNDVVYIPDDYFNEDVEGIAEEAFAYSDITEVWIPKNIKSIGRAAFSYCDDLETVKFESSMKLKTIPESCFSHCSSLKTIDIPYGVTTIDKYAFMDCAKLEKVIIPETVTSINECAFDDCPNLKYVALGNGSNRFSGISMSKNNLNILSRCQVSTLYKESTSAHNYLLGGVTINGDDVLVKGLLSKASEVDYYSVELSSNIKVSVSSFAFDEKITTTGDLKITLEDSSGKVLRSASSSTDSSGQRTLTYTNIGKTTKVYIKVAYEKNSVGSDTTSQYYLNIDK